MKTKTSKTKPTFYLVKEIKDMKCKCTSGILCNDGASFYRGDWYDCEKRKWGYVVTDEKGNRHDFTFASFRQHFGWK